MNNADGCCRLFALPLVDVCFSQWGWQWRGDFAGLSPPDLPCSLASSTEHGSMVTATESNAKNSPLVGPD